jgi:hypothetical protein
VTALDIIFEVILLLYPVLAILRLQTSLGKKITVILVLSCRVLYVDLTTDNLPRLWTWMIHLLTYLGDSAD